MQDIELISINPASEEETSSSFWLAGRVERSHVFRVHFDTSADLNALSNGYDPYSVHVSFLRGKEYCAENYREFAPSREFYPSPAGFSPFSRVYDHMDYVGKGQSTDSDYGFYVGIEFDALREFVSSGAEEPVCFYIYGYQFMGGAFASNLVFIPHATFVDAIGRIRVIRSTP